MKKIILIAVAVLFVGCTQPEKAEQVLRQQGYTNIEITGWEPFMKGEDDVFSTGFTATAQNGETVRGAVTGGWFKGSTVRLK